jgi:hypothetical protein
LTEPGAVEQYGKENVKVYTTSFTAMYYSMMEKEDKAPTKYKIVCQGPQEKIVGLHILGLGSGEMLQGFAVAIVRLSPLPNDVSFTDERSTRRKWAQQRRISIIRLPCTQLLQKNLSQ